MNNIIYLLAITAIILCWILIIKFLYPFLKKKGFEVNKKDKTLLLILFVIIFMAFFYTYIITEGTFILG
jgi:hypothetical protein